MIGSYTFWKWAENDLPGRPLEVQAALTAGRKHPALQPFDPRPLVKKLERAAVQGRKTGDEWDWQIVEDRATGLASFVFVTCPQVNETEPRLRRFARQFSWLGLSGFDEATGQVIPCLCPKHNCFISGQIPSERYYDIEAGELPYLIRRIDGRAAEAFGILEDSRRFFVQCSATGRRFCVEWAQNVSARGTTQWDQWRAQDTGRLAALGGVYDGAKIPENKDPDLLRYAETLRIFEAFLRREPRPARVPWRNINNHLS